MVDANATAFVGMNNAVSAQCFCSLENTAPGCYNGGTLVTSSGSGMGGSDYYCVCPDGFKGPRCEQLSLRFTFSAASPSHSYALFDAFKLCDPMRVEFEFITERSKGLLLFNGPVNRDSTYFIAAEIYNRTLLVHIGYTNISFANVNVSDRAWHRVSIAMSLGAVQVVLDSCHELTAQLANYAAMVADQQRASDASDLDKVRLSLGGIPLSISTNHFYYSVLNVFEYEGCIRNVRVNGELRDLHLSGHIDEHNLADNSEQCDCEFLALCDPNTLYSRVDNKEFPWWIIIIIVGILFMLGKSSSHLIACHQSMSSRNVWDIIEPWSFNYKTMFL